MRKIKHWAGYGTVQAGVIKDGSCKLHVMVTGVHECGLRRDDLSDLYKWLVKRFDKSVPDELTWLRSRPIVDIREDWSWQNDICHYYFTY